MRCRGLQGLAKLPYLSWFRLLCFAQCCNVLRSRWCQSGVNRCIVASRLSSRGAYPKDIQHPAGHASIQLTLDRYSPGCSLQHASKRLNQYAVLVLPERNRCQHWSMNAAQSMLLTVAVSTRSHQQAKTDPLKC